MKRPSNMFLQLASAMIMPELMRLPKSTKPAHLMWVCPLPLVRFATLCRRRLLLIVLLAGFAAVMGLPGPAFGLQDPLFDYQWYHLNKGLGGGTSGADARTSLAWEITKGSKDTIIAIVEPGGFDLDHEDLNQNLWKDKNAIDDTFGWNFKGCKPTDTISAAGAPSCGAKIDNSILGNHGTLVAGVAAAVGNNNKGITGACPQCSIMLLRTCHVPNDPNDSKDPCSGTTAEAVDAALSLAYKYAQLHGAKIINNSHTPYDYWGPAPVPPPPSSYEYYNKNSPNTQKAILDAIDHQIVVLFTAGNFPKFLVPDVNVCDGNDKYPLVSFSSVIAVSSSTNKDQRAGFGVLHNAQGNCIAILAPSWHQDPGTLGITTTSRGGFNPGAKNGTCDGTLPELDDTRYTNCFGGTSSATALTAGAVGLILSANPSLTPLQVKRLLQDTADKIEDSAGAYSSTTGFSSPATGTGTHAFGRINALEAVRIADLAVGNVAKNVKPRADIFVRDNDLDWGNASQPSSLLLEPTRGFIAPGDSPDIKVGSSQVPPTLATFDSFSEAQLTFGKKQWVYVRVRNRSPITAESVRVKLYVAQFNTSLPELPLDFWNNFPDNPKPSQNSLWHLAGNTTINDLKYSGASVAGCPDRAYPSCPADPGTVDPNAKATDNAQIVPFEVYVPIAYPSGPNLSLLVIIDSPQDPVSPKSKKEINVGQKGWSPGIAAMDNNIALRNFYGSNKIAESNIQYCLGPCRDCPNCGVVSEEMKRSNPATIIISTAQPMALGAVTVQIISPAGQTIYEHKLPFNAAANSRHVVALDKSTTTALRRYFKEGYRIRFMVGTRGLSRGLRIQLAATNTK